VAVVIGVGLASALAVLVWRAQDRPSLPEDPTVIRDDALLMAGDPGQVAAALGTMKRLGADLVRVTADWSAIALRPDSARVPRFDAADPGRYPAAGWRRLDRVVRLARARGLRVMIDVTGPPPRWAEREASAAGPIDPRRFRDFAAAVARRYSGRFRGIPAAAAFALWNEPNRAAHLTPQWRRRGGRWALASADAYRELVTAAYPAIKRGAPGSLVLVGNTAPGGSSRPAGPAGDVAAVRFLRALACVSDRGEPVGEDGCAAFRPLPGDGWAHHPDAGVADLRRLTRLLARLHAGGRLARPMPLYVTEHGAAAASGLYDHARWLGEVEYLVWRTPEVRGFAQVPLRDPRAVPGAWGPGLELASGIPKPALGAFAHTLVVHRRGAHRVTIWGHVRPGSGRRRFRVSVRQLDGSWRTLPLFRRPRRTDEQGYFLVEAGTAPGGLPLDPAATFRLELFQREDWRPAGMPIFGAASAPRPVTPAAGSRSR
jgi:hypothetical protein